MKALNKYSRTITQDPSLPAAQAMLHAIGLTREDLHKAQIGIASTGWEGNPCNPWSKNVWRTKCGKKKKKEYICIHTQFSWESNPW